MTVRNAPTTRCTARLHPKRASRTTSCTNGASPLQPATSRRSNKDSMNARAAEQARTALHLRTKAAFTLFCKMNGQYWALTSAKAAKNFAVSPLQLLELWQTHPVAQARLVLCQSPIAHRATSVRQRSPSKPTIQTVPNPSHTLEHLWKHVLQLRGTPVQRHTPVDSNFSPKQSCTGVLTP